MANKKVKIDAKPKVTSTPTTPEAEESPVLEVSTPTPEPTAVKATKGKLARTTRKAANKPAVASVEAEPAPVPESTKEQASEKGVKMKRLTLDISKPLHKAIKAKAVEEGISIVDMLRALLKEHYSK
jgi:outer membrane biosynthesis protein TonB